MLFTGHLGDPNAVGRRKGFFNVIEANPDLFNAPIEVATEWDAATALSDLFAVAPADAAGGPGPVAFASLTFTPGAPGSLVVVPRLVVRRRDGRAWLTVVGDGPVSRADLTLPDPPAAPPPPQRVRYAGASAAEIAWIDAVDTAVRRIRARAPS